MNVEVLRHDEEGVVRSAELLALQQDQFDQRRRLYQRGMGARVVSEGLSVKG